LQHDKIWGDNPPPAPNSGGLVPPFPRDLRPCLSKVKDMYKAHALYEQKTSPFLFLKLSKNRQIFVITWHSSLRTSSGTTKLLCFTSHPQGGPKKRTPEKQYGCPLFLDLKVVFCENSRTVIRLQLPALLCLYQSAMFYRRYDKTFLFTFYWNVHRPRKVFESAGKAGVKMKVVLGSWYRRGRLLLQWGFGSLTPGNFLEILCAKWGILGKNCTLF